MKINRFVFGAVPLLAAALLLVPQFSTSQILSSVGSPNAVTFTNTPAANVTLSPGPSFGALFSPNCAFASGGTFTQAATAYSAALTTRIGTKILPAAGYKLNVTAIRLKVQGPVGSPVKYRIAYSLDGGTTVASTNGTDLAPAQTGCASDMGSNTAEVVWDMPDFEVTNTTNGLVVRVYFFDAAGGRAAYATNLTVDGTVQSLTAQVPPNTGPATNHYLSSSLGDDSYTDVQAQNPATPWKTLARLNAYLPHSNPGDSILFARGNTFDGTITMVKPGTAGKPIVFTAYGTGRNPVINGATTLNGWTQTSPNLWETTCASCEAATPTALFIDGIPQGMGRWPNLSAANKGYRTITSASGSNQIADSGLGGASPPTTNWVGAEAVVRTRAYLLDRLRISAQNGNSLSFATNTTNNLLTGFGYFIQNHPSTVDSQGEWFFNPSTKKVTLYSAADPNARRIEVPQVGTLATATNLGYLTIRSLTFSGAKTAALSLSGLTNFVFSENQILASGIDGLQLASGVNANITIENNFINQSQSKALRCIACTNAVVRGNTMNNSGTIAGMGASGNGTYGGIGITGSDLLIENNRFDSTGYVPLGWNGSNVLIKNNVVTNFCYLKDDGGGIYTQSLGNFSNRKITGNIILNGPGAPEGSGIYTIGAGIYMDDFSPNAELTDNTIAGCDFGVYLHNSGTITLRNNTLYDHEFYQIWFKGDLQTPGYLIENYTVEDNVFVSPRNLQRLYDFITPVNNFDRIGTFDANYYVRPRDSTLSILVEDYPAGVRTRRFADLAGWQTVFGQDSSSKSTVVPYAPYTVNSEQANLVTNGTFDTGSAGWTLTSSTGNATVAVDNAAVLDGNSLKVSFSANSTASSVPAAKLAYAIGPVTAGKHYRLNFSTIGSTANRTILAYLQSPANADASLRRPLKLQPTRDNYEVLLTATSTLAACNLVFVVFEQPALASFHLDNVEFREVEVTFPNPDDHIRFVYNPSAAPQTFSLDGAYKNARQQEFTGSVVVAPFASQVLFKQTETTYTLTAESGVTLTQGQTRSDTIATVSPSGLPTTVTVTASASANGVSLANVQLNPATGLVTAEVTATCSATNATFTLTLNGATAPTAQLAVTVNPLTLTASLTGTATLCAGSSTTLGFSGTPNATVTYTVNGGSNQTILLDGSGAGSVSTGSLTASATYALVSVSLNGCSQAVSGSATVTINALPTASLSGGGTACAGSAVAVSFSGTPNATVTYTVNGGSNQTILLDGSGAASVSTGSLTASATYALVSVSLNGCSQAASGSASVTAGTATFSGSPTLGGTPLTAGQHFTLTFATTTDCPFPAGNVFTAQLSDAGGNFTSPVNLGVVNPGTTSLTLPAATAPGAGYQIRIVASNPGLTSASSAAFAVAGLSSLKVLHQDGDNGQLTNNQLKPNLQLRNTGLAAIPYPELKVRYWFTSENHAALNTWMDYAQVGNGNVTMTYVRLTQPRQGADGYVEYAFTTGAGNLAAGGNSGPIQSRIAKQNWTNFNEADDYSFAANSAYTETGKITLYRQGQLVWGTEPALVPALVELTVQSENKNGNPATNTISTFLKINNTGNVAVAYKDLSVRYWLSTEGPQALNYWVDYAELGNGKVKGQFTRLSPPRTGADAYFELKIDSTAGTLFPLSTSGNIQYRLAKADWSAFNETNDHSYRPAGPIANNDHLTLYYQGQLLYGIEPPAGSNRLAAEGGEGLRVVVSPNPTDDPMRIQVTGAGEEPLTVELLNAAGQALRSQSFRRAGTEEVLRWRLRDQPPGLYLIRVTTPSQRQTVKVVH